MKTILGIFLVLAQMAWPSKVAAHDIYTEWKNPITGHDCCNNKDCRPVNWRLGKEGNLEIEVAVNLWITPNPYAELKNINDPSGRAHWCGEVYGTLIHTFCYLPPRPPS